MSAHQFQEPRQQLTCNLPRLVEPSRRFRCLVTCTPGLPAGLSIRQLLPLTPSVLSDPTARWTDLMRPARRLPGNHA